MKVTGSLAVGGVIFTVAGRQVWDMFRRPGHLFYDSKRQQGHDLLKEDADFVSPYRRVYGFEVEDLIRALDVVEGSIYLALPGVISVYGLSGERQATFSTRGDIRDIAVHEGLVYALFPSRIEVYDRQGSVVKAWDACSDAADYCSLAVSQDGVFVTDASAKNICKYSLDGTLSCFIRSPQGFVVPSYCFGITIMEGTVYCSNPGRHQVESYTPDGEFIAAFGKSGTAPGSFCGCCNPVFLTPSNNGELLTSEKGIPRISCYGSDGTFRSLLLDGKALGGGHAAYDVRVMKDRLVVAGGSKVSVFQYDKRLSQQTACGQCEEDCPLKTSSY